MEAEKYGNNEKHPLKYLICNKVDLENNKNLIILSVVLTVGVGGIALGLESLKGVSLSMILGVILNLILVEKKPKPKQIN